MLAAFGVVFSDDDDRCRRVTPSGTSQPVAGRRVSGEDRARRHQHRARHRLVVLARFNGRLPGEVQFLSRDGDGQTEDYRDVQEPQRSRLRHARADGQTANLSYAVRFGDEQTDWFKASVLEYPDLKQADANLKYPTYTGLAEKQVQDIRSITAVEGTKATLVFPAQQAGDRADAGPRARRALARRMPRPARRHRLTRHCNSPPTRKTQRSTPCRWT